VIIADIAEGSAAVEEIKRRSGNDKVSYMHLDLGCRSSIESFVAAFKSQYDRLDILVNNAGLVCSND